MRLSDFSQDRNNNFNLIRIVAALAVLVSHSFPLAIGHNGADPLKEIIGMTMGNIAVDVFFITSGFLVTSSLLNRQSIIGFVWARVLRIFPALLAMLLLTIFVLGVYFTSWSILNYLSSGSTYIYLAKCSTLITGVAFNLPGVFANVPYSHYVNGSLWTMTHEVRLYAILALIWIILRIAPNRLYAFNITIVALAFVSGFYLLVSHFRFSTTHPFAGFFFMFFVGAAFYILKQHIVLLRWLLWFFVAGLLLAAVSKQAFFVVYVFTIAYILFYVAYVPSGFVRKYNQLGDYSYGIYIYAWPMQQSVAALIPGVTVFQMILISGIATLSLAILSWHLLEQRALNLKANCIGHAK